MPWTFTGDRRRKRQASGFTNGDPKAPSGTRLPSSRTTPRISQTVYLQAGVYNLSLLAAQRIQYQTQTQAIEVLVDGQKSA